MKGHMSRVRGTLRSDHGFTLVEALVALAILSIIVLSLTLTTISGYRALRVTRGVQQATALGNEAIEATRNLNFDDLVMVDADLTGDPNLMAECPPLTGTKFFDPDESGPLGCEEIVSSESGGGVTPHITTSTIDNTTFTVRRYITWVVDDQIPPARTYKRVVARVEWTVNDVPKTYTTSTFVTNARRGLPTPRFVFNPVDGQTVHVQPGNEVVFAHSIQNQGIIDAYDIAVTDISPSRSWSIDLYEDVDVDGGFDPAVDTLLTDTNGTGVVDTDRLPTDNTFHFLAVWELAADESVGWVDVTFTGTSGMDISIEETAVDTIKVGDVGLGLYLHDNPTPPTANQIAEKDLSMNSVVPTAGVLYKYSTNWYPSGQAGRYIDTSGGSSSEANTRRMVNWVYQIPNPNTTFTGRALLDIWVAPQDFTCEITDPEEPSVPTVVDVTAYLREKTNATTNSGTVFATANGSMVANGSGTCGFKKLTLTFPTINRTIAQNRWVELKLVVKDSSFIDGLFAYDTTVYAAKLELPQVSS